MSDSTHDALRALQAELSRAPSSEVAQQLLTAVLDAHVIDVTGMGSETLASGETIHDPEDLLGVGAMVAGRTDTALNAVPITWVAAAPDAARLHVVTWLLTTLWRTAPPPAEQVRRLLDAFEVVNPQAPQTCGALLSLLNGLPTDGELSARISALGGALRSATELAPESAPESAPRSPLDPPLDPPPDARFPALVAALDAEDPGARTEAASALGDLLHGDVNSDDFAHVVAGLLARAARESNVTALETMLDTLSLAADRPGSGSAADWDPALGLLQSVNDPEGLAHLLTALGLARHEHYRASITPFLSHEDGRVREAASGALGELDSVA